MTEPVIWAVGHEFHVVTSIRRANISDGSGWMALEMEGDEEQISGAIEYLKERGIGVEPIDDNGSAGV